MTLSQSLKESPVKQISSKDNLDNQVCTHYLELLCLLLQVLYQNPPQLFQPITSAVPQEAANTHKTNRQQSAETSPESSLPCGQWTPIASASVTSTPSQHTPPQLVVPPQPAIPQFPSPNNIHPHTQHQNTPQVSPITQPRPQSPLRTNTNPPTQPFIQAAETHKSMSSSP